MAYGTFYPIPTDNFAQAFLSPPHTPIVLLQYKPYGACTYTAPITMVHQPHANVASLPLPFASAIPTGMLNEYSLSCTLAANNETKKWLDIEISTVSFPPSSAYLYHLLPSKFVQPSLFILKYLPP